MNTNLCAAITHVRRCGLTSEEHFAQFHEANLHVYDELARLSFRMLHSGRKRYSIRGLFEVLRWNRSLATQTGDWKLNNSLSAHYARKLMRDYPELDGFFELRERAVAV